jgi:hypothetical protein
MVEERSKPEEIVTLVNRTSVGPGSNPTICEVPPPYHQPPQKYA